jgi:hypothetical protein
MRIVVILLAVVVGFGLVVVLVGLMLPVKHEAAVSAAIPAAPEAVWAALTDPARYPTWRGVLAMDAHGAGVLVLEPRHDAQQRRLP